MIDPPQVRPEEPTAVTPHGGIRGGKSQRWLSYPTKLHVRICEGGRRAIDASTRPYAERSLIDENCLTESVVISQ
jgi:hypothetical protein